MVTKTKQRDRAKAIYVQASGNISDSALGKKVGVTRKTIARWKKSDKWCVQIRRPVHIGTGPVCEMMEPELRNLDQTANSAKVINSSATRKLFRQDKDGDLLRDIHGQPQINTDLKPADYRALTASLKDSQILINKCISERERIIRFDLEVQKDQQNAIDGHRSAAPDNSTPGPIDRIMEGMDNGTIDTAKGQDALMEMGKAFQNLMAVADGEEPIL